MGGRYAWVDARGMRRFGQGPGRCVDYWPLGLLVAGGPGIGPTAIPQPFPKAVG
jgi:hypothetical protein